MKNKKGQSLMLLLKINKVKKNASCILFFVEIIFNKQNLFSTLNSYSFKIKKK